MIKLIALDLDDTLLNSKSMISEYTKYILNQCHRYGFIIGYITGRSPRRMKEFLRGLPCDFLVNYNGASIFIENVLIKNHVIPFWDGMNFINKALTLAPNIKISAYFEPYFCNS